MPLAGSHLFGVPLDELKITGGKSTFLPRKTNDKHSLPLNVLGSTRPPKPAERTTYAGRYAPTSPSQDGGTSPVCKLLAFARLGQMVLGSYPLRSQDRVPNVFARLFSSLQSAPLNV